MGAVFKIIINFGKSDKMSCIAIDGPSSAGKSSIAKELSKYFGYIYLDTGALYRAIGYYFFKNGIDYKDKSKVIDELKNIKIVVKFENGLQRVFLCNEDISDKIRSNEISMIASEISAISEVREYLLSLQRDTAKNNNVIMDGRDIGTVVLPEADLKIYLTASPEIRSRRRYDELRKMGYEITYNEVLKSINERDYNDTNRASAPLKPAEDAIIIDTTNYDFDKSVKVLIDIIKEKIL